MQRVKQREIGTSRARARRGPASALAVLGVALACLGLLDLPAAPALAGQLAASGRLVYLPLVVAPADNPSAVRFAVIGDYGTASQDERAVADMVKGWKPDFIITVGDNNYSSGSAATIDRNIGQFYSDYIAPYGGRYGGGARNRFFPALGNHDWYARDATPYLQYFVLPAPERYYDVTWGPVRLFALDSDPHEPDGVTSDSAQAQWFQRTLAASTSCWNVAYFHHPPFSSGEHGSNDWMQWPFRAWGADAVLSGHDHVYERVVVSGFPYFVNGLGGKSRYSFREPVSGSAVRYNAAFGAMLVEATRTAITYNFIAVGGMVVDRYTQRGGCSV